MIDVEKVLQSGDIVVIPEGSPMRRFVRLDDDAWDVFVRRNAYQDWTYFDDYNDADVAAWLSRGCVYINAGGQQTCQNNESDQQSE